MDWLFEHAGDADIDEPLALPPRNATSSPGKKNGFSPNQVVCYLLFSLCFHLDAKACFASLFVFFHAGTVYHRVSLICVRLLICVCARARV